MIYLTQEKIDPEKLMEQVRQPDCGAVVTFFGTVRKMTHGRETKALEYEALATMAEKKMAEIEEVVRRRWDIGAFVMAHRLGRLEIGEISVGIAVSCAHRADAFDACRCAIESLKEFVPIWKKECWADGTSDWVHSATHESGQ